MDDPDIYVKSVPTWKRKIKEWIVIPVIGGMAIALAHDFNLIKLGRFNDFTSSFLVSSIFWSVLANGNGVIVSWIDLRWTWLQNPVKRVAAGLTGLILYTVAASLVIIYVYVEQVLGYSFPKVVESQGLFSLLRIPLGITLIIALWQHGQGFLLEWRQAAIDVERLKNENLKSRFESLKSQVNPHFLFNSLNALTSLVYSDQGKAVAFIQKLSEVYRYVLEHQNEEVVSLQTEIDFLKSYVYLNKIRFGDNFEVKYINLERADPQHCVPPVTLQMLVENCIKHNEISKQKHLSIRIEKVGMDIIVENNINPIKVAKQDSNGLGLSNIISRYNMLSDQKVEVAQTENHFRVKIPILSFEG